MCTDCKIDPYKIPENYNPNISQNNTKNAELSA